MPGISGISTTPGPSPLRYTSWVYPATENGATVHPVRSASGMVMASPSGISRRSALLRGQWRLGLRRRRQRTVLVRTRGTGYGNLRRPAGTVQPGRPHRLRRLAVLAAALIDHPIHALDVLRPRRIEVGVDGGEQLRQPDRDLQGVGVGLQRSGNVVGRRRSLAGPVRRERAHAE